MKGLSKPISSPGRTEKFPPPLMRFLRSNVGSRSRGRTRASPMFMRKNSNNNKNNVSIETTQEPSSPKVTCIGQVRVRRSSKSTAHGGGNRSTRRSSSTRKQKQKQKQQGRQNKPCCCNFRVKLHRPKSLISVLRKWVSCCFRFGGYCGGRRRRVETVDSSSRVESTQRVQSRVSTTSTESIETTVKIEPFVTENDGKGFVGSNNPPKNALILTRCRSAPYRSSSLASRFWGSPLNHSSSSDTENQIPQINIEQNPVLENPISSPKDDGNGDSGSRKSNESEEEMQSSINGRSSKGEEEEEEEEEEEKNGGNYVHPLLLTRCKSEPARTGERLNPTRFTELDPQS